MIDTVRRQGFLSRPMLDNRRVGEAALRALAYADVFDYALTLDQIRFYLIGVLAGEPEVRDAVCTELLQPGRIERHGAFYCLSGRGELAALRVERRKHAEILWPRAVRYGRRLAALPYVRMAAVTGALAVDNEPGWDLDFLIVTTPGRLWLCRGMAMLLVRLARSAGDELCPNYFISTRALGFTARNLYAAHELVQMIPLSGRDVYMKIRRENTWVSEYLPNADSSQSRDDIPAAIDGPPGRLRKAMEIGLATPIGEWLEQWEMTRKIRRLQAQDPVAGETLFDCDQCKGHFGGYGGKTLLAYRERLAKLGLSDD